MRSRFQAGMFAALMLAVGVLCASPASAQTGPGGVGDATGTVGSEGLTIWLRSDVGVDTMSQSTSESKSLYGKTEVELWKDQSGQGHDFNEAKPANSENNKRQPIYKKDALNGNPVVKFDLKREEDGDQDKTDFLVNTDTDVKNLSKESNTFFLVSLARSVPTDNNWQIVHFQDEEENLMYRTGDNGGGIVADESGPELVASPTLSEYNVFSSVFDNNDKEEDIAANGTIRSSASGVDAAGSGTPLEISADDGTRARQNIAEIVAYGSALNTAQRRLVANYLAEKYALPMASNDYYRFGTGHPDDIAGIGRTTSDAGGSNGGTHTKASSGELTLQEGSNALNDGEFVMVGHDGKASGSFTTDERPNGKPNAQKIEREWRAEVTGTGSKKVDVEVDYSSLSLPGGYNDRAVFVDDDGDFTSGATFYDLDNKSGDVYEASGVKIEDGDHVTVAAIKRVVNFATTSSVKRENSSGKLAVDLSLSFPLDSDLTVEFSDTGDIASPAGIQDDGTNDNGANDNGDYEADNGSGNQSTADYSLPSGSPPSVDIGAGSTTATLEITVNDDGIQEQSEKFEATISSVNGAGTKKGADDRFVGTIIDDDNPVPVAYSDNNDSDGRSPSVRPSNRTTVKENTAGTITYEVAVPSGETGQSSPATELTYKVASGAATPGGSCATDGVDFKLSGGPNGTALTDTKGTVTIPDADQYGQFEVEICDDNTFEDDEKEMNPGENFTLEFIEAQGGTVDGDDKTEITTRIEDQNDTQPTVEFASERFTSRENKDADLTVTLSSAVGSDVTVSFDDQGTGSAPPADYTFPAADEIIIPAGDTKGTFTIPINDDDTKESNKDIDVEIASVTVAAEGSQTTTSHTIVDDDGIGSQGPGGVGNDQSLAFWGKVGGLSSSNSDGDKVAPWPDSSGNGHTAEEVETGDLGGAGIKSDGARFETDLSSVLNGQPVLGFHDSDSPLRFYKVSAPVMRSLPDANYTLFSVSNYASQTVTTDNGDPGGDNAAILDIMNAGGTRQLALRYDNSGKRVSILNKDDGDNLKRASYSYNSGDVDAEYESFDLISAEMEGDELDISYDGAERATTTPTASTFQGTGTAGIIGYTQGGNWDFKSNMAELIVYDTDLNSAQRNIVRNYLSAKYDLGLDTGNGAKDLYAGDTNGNGDYDYHVIGIGREGGNSRDFLHPRADGAGVTLNEDVIADGEYIMLGTTAKNPRGPAQRLNYDGTGGVPDLAARPDSIWFAESTGSPSFDITFDLTALGFESRSRPPDGYVLLKAGAGSCTPDSDNCSWSDAGGSVVVTGDEVTFSGVSLSSGGHYLAIGTTAPTESPLVSAYARPVDGQAGADGADEGWRYVGVPVRDATINDLQPPLSTDRDGLMGFGQRDVWYWAMNGGSTDGWTPFQSGEAAPNGRGFIVKLDDDNEHPIDPTLWMDVEPNSLPPGNADVTVGDGTPAADSDLKLETKWNLLANPYAKNFDLGSLNLGTDADGDGDADFKKCVYLWDSLLETYKSKCTGDSDNDLAPWEAVFAQRSDFTDDGGTRTQLTFSKGGRLSGEGEDFIGSKSQSAPRGRKLNLRVVVRDGSGNEEARDEAAMLYFHDDAGPEEDAFDLSKLMPAEQDFAALSFASDDRAGDRTLWAVHSRTRTPDDTVTVPLDLQTDLNGAFEIAAPDWHNVPSGWTATLIDTKNDTTHTLGRDGASPYAFSPAKSKRADTTAEGETKASGTGPSAPSLPPVQTLEPRGTEEANSADSTAKAADAPTNRFVLRVVPRSEPSSPEGDDTDEEDASEDEDTGGSENATEETAPVETASVEADVNGTSVQLSWETDQAPSSTEWHIEHQRLPPNDTTADPDPDDWTERKTVNPVKKAKASQTPSITMKRLDYGRHAFRLRADYAGESVHSEAVEAKLRLEEAYKVGAPYPNPVRQQATLEVTVREEQSVRVLLYDILGRRIQTVYDDPVPAQETKRLRIDANRLSSGAYFVRIRGEDFTETRRMTVVR